ncbi:MAG: phosphate acyltransferase PlsX [Planctomycetota bacterium]|nr:phosphate acyltransferase PlsX [Planctomycetota bacterium]
MCGRVAGVTLLLYGEEEPMNKAFKALRADKPDNIDLHYCCASVEMDDSPVEALRTKRDSSAMCGIEAVRDDKADAFVSAGNTGLCVAATTLRWRLLPGVKRAGIAIAIPTGNGPMVAIDMGANVESKPEHLFGYAVMASVYSSSVFEVSEPRVALLNVGTEEKKGNRLVADARALLEESHLRFTGYLEGNHLFEGHADVIVCDGFVGNLIMKTAEGVAEFMGKEIKTAVKSTPAAMLGGLLLKGALKRMKRRFDYTTYGGAQLLGVNGVCIISHGRSGEKAIRNALRLAEEGSEGSQPEDYRGLGGGAKAVSPKRES